MAERLRSGLQIRVARFDSGSGLQFIEFTFDLSESLAPHMPLNWGRRNVAGVQSD
jgi:hypothetical protein